jgi:ferredoxin
LPQNNEAEKEMIQDQKERPVSGLTVRIDRTRCIATANCIKLAPELFELDEERIVAFRQEAVEPGQETLLEACDACPVDAIAVFDAAGRQIVPS